MLIDGIYLTDTSAISNLIVASGTTPPTGAPGELFYRTDLSALYISNGTSWTPVTASSTANITAWTGLPWDISGSVFGIPAASQVDIRFNTARAFILPANLNGSLATAGVAGTNTTVWNIQKNSVTVATITFNAGASTGTFSAQAAVSFVAGDKFRVVAPSTPDATLADIDFTLMATLS